MSESQTTAYQDNFPLVHMNAITYTSMKKDNPDCIFHMMVNTVDDIAYPGPAYVWYTADGMCDMAMPAFHLHEPIHNKIINNLRVLSGSVTTPFADATIMKNVLANNCTWDTMADMSRVSSPVRSTLVQAVADMFNNMNGLYYYERGTGNPTIERIENDITSMDFHDLEDRRDALREIFMEFFGACITNDGVTHSTRKLDRLVRRFEGRDDE